MNRNGPLGRIPAMALKRELMSRTGYRRSVPRCANRAGTFVMAASAGIAVLCGGVAAAALAVAHSAASDPPVTQCEKLAGPAATSPPSPARIRTAAFFSPPSPQASAPSPPAPAQTPHSPPASTTPSPPASTSPSPAPSAPTSSSPSPSASTSPPAATSSPSPPTRHHSTSPSPPASTSPSPPAAAAKLCLRLQTATGTVEPGHAALYKLLVWQAGGPPGDVTVQIAVRPGRPSPRFPSPTFTDCSAGDGTQTCALGMLRPNRDVALQVQALVPGSARRRHGHPVRNRDPRRDGITPSRGHGG